MHGRQVKVDVAEVYVDKKEWRAEILGVKVDSWTFHAQTWQEKVHIKGV